MKSQLITVPRGRAGIKNTLRVMRDITRKFSTNLTIRTLAMRIAREARPFDFCGEAAAIQRYVQKEIRYTRDVAGVETIQTPIATLSLAAGDCDDQSILFGSLASSIGIPVRYVAVGRTHGSLTHVLPYVNIDGKWLACECIYDWPMGKNPPGVADTEYIDV